MKSQLFKWIMAVGFVALAGCGVAEYEKQMDRQRQRIQEFDDANKLLEDPLEMPKGAKEAPAWLFEFYLRLPKGYGTNTKEKDRLPIKPPFPCFRYAGPEPGSNLLIVAAMVGKPKDPKKDADPTPEQFRASVRDTIEEFYTRTGGLKLKFPDKLQPQVVEFKRFTPLSNSDEKVAYELVTYSDSQFKTPREHVGFQAYFHKDAERQVCIVVNRPLRLLSDAAFRKAMDLSLGTLDISAEASNKRAQFLRLKTAVRK